MELADEMCNEISASLRLDREILPLNFLRSVESEAEESDADDSEDKGE